MRQRGPVHVAFLTGSFGKISQSTIISVFTHAPLTLLSVKPEMLLTVSMAFVFN